MKTKTEREQTTIRLPAELKERLQQEAAEMGMRKRKNVIKIELNVRCENLKNLGKIIEIVSEETKEYPHAKIKMNITQG